MKRNNAAEQKFWTWNAADYRGTKDYDGKFQKLQKQGMTWLPWVGSKYKKDGLLVVAESNYADENAGATPAQAVNHVNGDEVFTRRVISMLGMATTRSNKTLDLLAKLIHPMCGGKGDTFRSAWDSVAFMDICQTALWAGKAEIAGSGVKRRPDQADYTAGWKVVQNTAALLEASTVLVVSRASVSEFPLKTLEVEVEGLKKKTVYCKESTGRRWIFIDHPGYWNRIGGTGAVERSLKAWQGLCQKLQKMP